MNATSALTASLAPLAPLAPLPLASLTAPPWLASARLRLREFTRADVQDIANMHFDPRVRALLVDDSPLHELPTARGFIEGMQAFYRQHEGTGIWCAERAIAPDPESVQQARAACAAGEIDAHWLARMEAPTWRFAGWFNLLHLPGQPDALEIGARLLPEAWGGALALDGGEWLLARAFRDLGQMRVFGHCHPDNHSAVHCLRVLGFGAVGRVPYSGQQAARFVLERTHWAQWSRLPRRMRLRQVRQVKTGANTSVSG